MPPARDHDRHPAVTQLLDHHVDLNSDGSVDPQALPTHGGVYLIVDHEERPVLLATGQNLRRVVVHRLNAPPPDYKKTKRANLADVARRVYWRGTHSRFETAWLHWQIARTQDPVGYRKILAFPPTWFLRVDPTAKAPRFTPLREFPHDAASILGPFATRRHAEDWVRLLEDLFDLCRYHTILEQAPHGRPCAYFDMDKCPAPCDGSISTAAYRQMIENAVTFSTGIRQPRLAALRELMESQAESLAFEKAAAVRRTIERAKATPGRPEFSLLADLSAFCWLIVQRAGPKRRSPKNTLVRPFFVRRGTIEVGRPVSLANLDEEIPRWLARCGPCSVPPPASPDEQTARCEVLWLVGKFLFQAERAPGLFRRFDRLGDADELAGAVRERFGPAGKNQSPDDPAHAD